MYITQHWIFAFSYLRVAIVFKLVFSKRGPKLEQRLAKRVNLINLIAVSAFVFICLPILLQIGQGTFNERTYPILITVSYTCVASILSFSIYRIRKYSQMLVQNTVFTNEALMIAHLAAFAYLTLFIIVLNWITYSISDADELGQLTYQE